ncbi:MAG: methyltransferase domain-containing protein [Nocardioides sp.]|uniref:methyltransferase domain-containing protein n=1 Tax=Nocardioides sp. TaxID=35761 RepID=UPI0039E607F7
MNWDERYAVGDTPWDLGGAVPLLVDALEGGLLGTPGRALVPGCGRAYDAGALARAGWSVTAVDESPLAVADARALQPMVDVVLGDALDPTLALARTGGPVDLLWDHTFFCALDLDLRPAVGEFARAVVAPGGLVASGVFPIGRHDGAGPPHSYETDDMSGILGEEFGLIHLGPEHASFQDRFPDFRTRLAIWRRGPRS